MSQDYLNALQKVALGCEEEERRFRREAERRIAALAEARTHAYRRYNVLKAMVEAASAEVECEASVSVQIGRVAALSGWSEKDAGWQDFRGALGDVASAIHADLHGAAAEAPVEAAARSVTEAFQAFETWYRCHFGAEFLALLEQPQAFQPAVDF